MAQLWVIFAVSLATFSPLINGAPQSQVTKPLAERGVQTSCERILGQRDFSLFKFKGGWFVGYHFGLKLPPCQYTQVDPISETEFRLTTSMIVSTNSSITGSGQGIILSRQNPGSMSWTWKFLPSNSEGATVIDTDYDNYAIIVFCLHGKRTGVLWTRNYIADPIYIERARQVLGPYVNSLPQIQPQNECQKQVNQDMSNVILDELFETTVGLIFAFNSLRLGPNLIN